jgi:uncharacterized protein (TIGR02611 family)
LGRHAGCCPSTHDEDLILTAALKMCRKIAIAIAGFTVLCVGVAMIVLPGPAFIVIPAGLGILAIEFAWAKRWLTEVKVRGSSALRYWPIGKSKTRSRTYRTGGDPYDNT